MLHARSSRLSHLDDTFGIPGSQCNMDSAGGARIRKRACNAVRSKLHVRVVAWPSRGFTKSNKDHVSDYLIYHYIEGTAYVGTTGSLYGVEYTLLLQYNTV